MTVDTMVDSKGQATFDVLITRDSNGNPQLVILQANGNKVHSIIKKPKPLTVENEEANMEVVKDEWQHHF